MKDKKAREKIFELEREMGAIKSKLKYMLGTDSKGNLDWKSPELNKITKRVNDLAEALDLEWHEETVKSGFRKKEEE